MLRGWKLSTYGWKATIGNLNLSNGRVGKLELVGNTMDRGVDFTNTRVMESSVQPFAKGEVKAEGSSIRLRGGEAQLPDDRSDALGLPPRGKSDRERLCPEQRLNLTARSNGEVHSSDEGILDLASWGSWFLPDMFGQRRIV